MRLPFSLSPGYTACELRLGYCSGWGGSVCSVIPYPRQSQPVSSLCGVLEVAFLLFGIRHMYCCRRQGLGSVRLHVRVPYPKAKLVEAGVAPTRPTLPPALPLHLLVCMWWESEVRPNGLIPKGSPGEPRGGCAGPRMGCLRGGGVSPQNPACNYARSTVFPPWTYAPADNFQSSG